MTGEITLRGRVLPVGGLKEKCLAAFRAGIMTVVLPDRNQKDLDDIPKQLRRKLRLLPVKNMSDVLKAALLDRSRKESSEALSTRRSKTGKRGQRKHRAKPLEKLRREKVVPLRARLP